MEQGYFSNYDWLLSRAGRFTASEIHKLFTSPRSKSAGLFGETAKTYILTKAAEILTGEVKEQINFKQAEWGHANEPEAMEEYEKRIGREGTRYGSGSPKFFELGEYAGCSPDWEYSSPFDKSFGAEIKCPYNSHEHLRNMLILAGDQLKEFKKEYYHQCQMCMLVRGWERCDYVSYDPRMIEKKYRLHVVEVYPDEDWRIEYAMRITEATKILQKLIQPAQKAKPEEMKVIAQPLQLENESPTLEI